MRGRSCRDDLRAGRKFFGAILADVARAYHAPAAGREMAHARFARDSFRTRNPRNVRD
jgi:hypothetical protein